MGISLWLYVQLQDVRTQFYWLFYETGLADDPDKLLLWSCYIFKVCLLFSDYRKDLFVRWIFIGNVFCTPLTKVYAYWQRFVTLFHSWGNSKDVWLNILKKENRYAHCKHFTSLHSSLQPHMRSILLDWLLEVCALWCLHRVTPWGGEGKTELLSKGFDSKMYNKCPSEVARCYFWSIG